MNPSVESTLGRVYTPSTSGNGMTKSVTGSFYLTESVTIAPGTLTSVMSQATVDLSAYVNVPTGQAIAIDSVDFVYQLGSDYAQEAASFLQANGAVQVQLTDLNPGVAMIRADGQSLIASGAVNIDIANNIASHEVDIYPDNFGPAALSESFLVVNDTLYLTGGPSGATSNAGADLYVTARIRCRVVKLSTKDWMAIAIQSTAEA
jgi:hypothetical protein